MELEELRRQWRQPEPAAPAPLGSGPDLDALLKGRALGPVEKMRRAAWFEAGFNVLVGLGLLVALPYLHDALLRAFAGLLLLIAAVLTGFYYRVLSTLQRMTELAGSVRGHLVTLAQGLRQLLRFYYRLTLASGPLTMLMLWGGELWRMGSRGLFTRWLKASIVVALFLLMGVTVQWVVMRFARWYLQRLYGQHLDRLEGQLRELDEGGPAAA